MKRLITIGLLMAGLTVSAQTDFEHFSSFSWDVNVPLSNLDYIGNTSTRGMRFGYHAKITDNFFAGADFSNVTFNDYVPRRTYVTNDGALTTDVFNYTYYYSLALTGDYFFSPSKKLSPFASFGIGPNYNSYAQYFNIYTETDSSWGLLVRPEAGAILKMGSSESWALIGSIHVDYSTAKSASTGYNGITSVGFRLGLAFPGGY